MTFAWTKPAAWCYAAEVLIRLYFVLVQQLHILNIMLTSYSGPVLLNGLFLVKMQGAII